MLGFGMSRHIADLEKILFYQQENGAEDFQIVATCKDLAAAYSKIDNHKKAEEYLAQAELFKPDIEEPKNTQSLRKSG